MSIKKEKEMKQNDKILTELLHDKEVKRVFGAIKQNYGYTLDELCSREKTYHISEARQMAMYILYFKTKLNATEIGLIINRNRATAYIGAYTIKDRLSYDKRLQERLFKLGYGEKPKKSRTISQEIEEVFKRIEKEYGYSLEDLQSSKRKRLLG